MYLVKSHFTGSSGGLKISGTSSSGYAWITKYKTKAEAKKAAKYLQEYSRAHKVEVIKDESNGN